MGGEGKAQQRRGGSNPLYGDRKLKLGTFGTNLDRGCSISTIDGVLEIDWPNTLTLAKIADEMEFEALVPVGRWKGFGGVTNFNGPGFECFSWAAGIGASTRHSAVFSTSHVLTVHPIMAAKQATTIDHITGGRFALNVVTGWHRPEMEMFGAPLLDHDDRYRAGGGMARNHQTAVDRGRRVRLRGPAFSDQQGLSRAETVATAVPAGDERRQLREAAATTPSTIATSPSSTSTAATPIGVKGR